MDIVSLLWQFSIDWDMSRWRRWEAVTWWSCDGTPTSQSFFWSLHLPTSPHPFVTTPLSCAFSEQKLSSVPTQSIRIDKRCSSITRSYYNRAVSTSQRVRFSTILCYT